MKTISYSLLEETEWPEDVFIESGVLSRGDTMMIAADSKAGKSTFICGLIRQLISGGNFLGFKVTRPLRVFYMQAELREGRLKERLLPTYSNLTADVKSNLYIWSTRGLFLFGENQIEIEAQITSVIPDILVIDPMLNFHNYNENNSQDMAQFFRFLDKVKERFDMAIIMAHHFRKPSQDPKFKSSLLDSIRGSTSLRGWAVTTIAMEGRGDSEYRELEFDFRNCDEPLKRVIKYNKVTKDFDWHDPVAIIGSWLKSNMNGKKLTTTQFIDYLLSNHGDLLSNNHTKAHKLKKSLLEYQIITEHVQGKKHLISMA